MAVLGFFGKVPFVCSDDLVLTFKDLHVSRSARFAQHDVIGRPPVVEYVGPGLAAVKFDVRLAAHLGAPPLVGLKLLQKLLRDHKPEHLMIGPDHIGKFVLEAVEENRAHHGMLGICTVAVVSLTLKEVA